MMLGELAHSRAGDKGHASMLSLIAFDPADYPVLRQLITPERVARHFSSMMARELEIDRYELPQLGALNFVLHGALAGGVTRSLAQDAHGKSLSSIFLGMELTDGEIARARHAVAKDGQQTYES